MLKHVATVNFKMLTVFSYALRYSAAPQAARGIYLGGSRHFQEMGIMKLNVCME